MQHSAFLRLVMFLSPAFPVGGFAYSSGLEQAATEGLVSNTADLQNWLATNMQSGPLWNDAVLLCSAHEGEENPVELSQLALALAGTKERHHETLNLGKAFVEAVKASALPCPDLPNDIAYPVAVGAIAKANEIELETTACAFIHAFVSNQIQCAIRLGITGQNGGVALLSLLENSVGEVGVKASRSSLDDLGSNMILADIVSMRHETLYSRIFRS